MGIGICKLTKVKGKYAKSHLIPHAFTKPEIAGQPLIQAGFGQPAVRRWSSWYDQKLVTAEGELILRDLDTWGISYLRRQKLVWSGWGPSRVLQGNRVILEETGWGIRSVDVDEPEKFRLFIYSLLWRAAASSMLEFSEISMPANDLERLRVVLLKNELPPIDFYPASLTQLSTLGIKHNLSPIAQVKTTPAIGSEPERQIPIFRLYFDGLIVHIHRHANDDGYTQSLGPQIVGNEKVVTVSTISYEKSFQLENLRAIAAGRL